MADWPIEYFDTTPGFLIHGAEPAPPGIEVGHTYYVRLDANPISYSFISECTGAVEGTYEFSLASRLFYPPAPPKVGEPPAKEVKPPPPLEDPSVRKKYEKRIGEEDRQKAAAEKRAEAEAAQRAAAEAAALDAKQVEIDDFFRKKAEDAKQQEIDDFFRKKVEEAKKAEEEGDTEPDLVPDPDTEPEPDLVTDPEPEPEPDPEPDLAPEPDEGIIETEPETEPPVEETEPPVEEASWEEPEEIEVESIEESMEKAMDLGGSGHKDRGLKDHRMLAQEEDGGDLEDVK